MDAPQQTTNEQIQEQLNSITTPGPSPSPGPKQWDRFAILLPALVALGTLLLLSPALLLQNNTPSGYDLGGHLYPYREGVRLLASEGRVHGWSHGWFGGFPLFYFYFPLPVLPLALLSPLLGFGAAMKVVSLLGVLILPFATMALLRGLSVGRLPAGIAAAFASLFLLMQSFWFLGGNIASTLAGEFSYGLSFALSIAYLGVISRAVDADWRAGPWAALLLAGTALSHLVTTLVVVLASATLLIDGRARKRVVLSWVHGCALAAFWTLPFLARIRLIPHMGWEWHRSVADILPTEVLPLVPFALLGALLASQLRLRAAPLLAAPAVAQALWLLPQQGFLPTRPLPYWFLALHVLAALMIAAAVQAWSNREGGATRRNLLLAGTAAAIALLFTNAFRDVGRLQSWAEFNFSGYEAKPGWPEYRALMDVLQRIPDGRVHWEDATTIQQYGTPHALTLIPYWTERTALGGLWVESSQLTPFYMQTKKETSREELTRTDPRIPEEHALVLERGVPHMRALGVRYYIAFTREAITRADTRPDLRRIAAGSSMVIYEIAGAAIVTVAGALPSVYDAADFPAAAHAWFDQLSLLDYPLVQDGPADWPRITSPDAVIRAPVLSAGGVVSNVRLERESVSFHTTAVGLPHVVRVNWFPNWRAAGAAGPYQAAPSFMVVVPSQSDVVLTWTRTPFEMFGTVVTLLALLALLAYPFAARRIQVRKSRSGS